MGGANPQSNTPEQKPRGRVIPHQPTTRGRIGAGIVHALIRALSATLRFEWRDQSGLFQGEDIPQVIFCIWHNRLALSLVMYREYVQRRQPSRRLAGLVSASRDGGFLAGILERFGVQPVRGSSSRRGPQALLEMTTWAKQGFDLAITPDGPRGPCYTVQEGVTSLAQLTGLPIVPVSYHLNWKVRANSWDRFQIPLPFARCVVNLGEPVHVPREATDTDRALLRQQLEEAMKAITRD